MPDSSGSGNGNLTGRIADPHNSGKVGKRLTTMRNLLAALTAISLLGVAMPLKHILGYPTPVRIVGWIHGGLFIAYCFALFGAAVDRGWPWTKNAKLFIAALLPFGPSIPPDAGWPDEDASTGDVPAPPMP